MNRNIPLVQDNSVNSINTSLCAINRAMGQNGVPEVNVNVNYNVTDEVSADNIYPVTSRGVKAALDDLDETVTEHSTITTSSDSTPYSQRVNTDKDKSVINKLIGASFAINQMIKNGNFTNTSNWGAGNATFTVANGTGKFTATARYGGISQFISVNKNNKILFIGTGKAYTMSGVNFILRQVTPSNPYLDTNIRLSSSETTYYKVLQLDSTLTSFSLRIQDNNSSNWGEVTFRNVMIIDLTQMFGPAIADRIYAMEQASEGSGVAWIKSFGFFNNSYYATDEGNIQNVKPSAHKVSASVVKWFTSRNISSQYAVSVYAEAVLKPNTNYTLYFRGANGASVYSNENIFTTIGTATLNGSLQRIALKTKTELPYNNSTRLEDGWSIFKNAQGNTVVPNFTEFYIVEEGVKADPPFSQIIPLADTELRGIPKLDSNNNLYFDGDVYYPNGDVIRKYGVVDLGSLTWARDTATEGTVTGRFVSAGISANAIPQSINSIMSNGFSVKAGSSAMQDKCYRIDNSKNLIITDTAYTDATAFRTAMNGVYLIYELATPTKETVTGYANPHILIRKGAEEFVDNRTVPLPVGHETEYAKLPSWLSNNVIFL